MNSKIILWDDEALPLAEKRSRLMKLQRWFCRWDEGASCTTACITAADLFNREGLEAEWSCMIDTVKMAYPQNIYFESTLPEDRGWIRKFFESVGRVIHFCTTSVVKDGELGDNVKLLKSLPSIEWDAVWEFIDGNPVKV